MNAANRNRSTPVQSNSWVKDIEPFLEGENEELFNCPADFEAENRTADQRDPTHPDFKGSFGANNQMHRMQGSDGNKVTLLDLGDGNDDGANESQFFVTPPGGTNDWAEDDENGQPFWDAAINDAGDRHAGNVNALRRDGSVSAESSDDLLENHPGSGSGDWVPWRVDETPWVGSSDPEADIDRDSDGIANDQDNCPDTPNPDQADADDDGVGDACNSDDPDEDGILSADDNCPNTYNPEQEDVDENGTGDACEDTGGEPPGEEASGCSPNTEVVVASPVVTGSFALAPSYKSGDAHNGDMYWTKEGNDGSAATFTTQITEPGEYRVYLWFDQRFDRSTQLSVTIQHADGNDEIVVDQTASTGEDWQYELGTYNFDDSGSVVLVNQMEKVNSWDQNYAVADAVKFECTSEGEALSGPNPCDPPTDPTGAVDRALEWLARQQQDDGSWAFDGSEGAFPSGATGLALLAFLGNGNTPFSGTYNKMSVMR